MITFKEFKEIIDFLKNFNNKADKIDSQLSDLSDSFYVNLLSGVTSKHEKIIVDLLNKLFNLVSYDKIGTDLEYWIYELEFGKEWKEDSIIDENGKSIKLKTTRDIYNYMLENYNKE